MRQQILALLVATTILFAGCFSGPPEPSPARSHTPTPTDASPTPSPDGTSVEYLVRTGTVSDTFETVNVSFQAVFVERQADLGPCYSELYRGPYKPTITPIGPPSGECHKSDPIRIDLTEVDSTRSIGNFTAPGSTAGHALIATTVTATYQNGTTVTGVKGAGGEILIESPKRPDGRYGVTLSIEQPPDERRYDYWVLWEQFDPSS